MTKMIGGVIYQGPSMLDGSPIVVVVTGFRSSLNQKTGRMLQTWIMRADIDPAESILQGKDDAICGDCPQRRNQGGACYVVVEQAPLQIWRNWKEGRYADWTSAFEPGILAGRAIRIGSYGDPAAVPVNVWRRVREQKITGWTGYTHQWRNALAYRPFLMASVDSEAEMIEAQAAGWRTYRVRGEAAPVLNEEVDCPSEVTTCENCGLCRGRARVAKSISIPVHGYLIGRVRRALPIAR